MSAPETESSSGTITIHTDAVEDIRTNAGTILVRLADAAENAKATLDGIEALTGGVPAKVRSGSLISAIAKAKADLMLTDYLSGKISLDMLLNNLVEEAVACDDEAAEYFNSILESIAVLGHEEEELISFIHYRTNTTNYNVFIGYVRKIWKKHFTELETNVNLVGENIKNILISQNLSNNDMQTDLSNEKMLILPKVGERIIVSRGIDLKDETAVVFSRNTWSREYSVEGCNRDYEGEICCRRLNYAIEHYNCNSQDNDLLMFELDGYDAPVFAGAMVEGYAEVGDIVRITLDNQYSFHFLILDVKSTQHTSQELAPNNQIQCEWGHGYLLEDGKVQLSICEFITAGNCAENNVQNTDSGAFLKDRSVVRAEIVDNIEICD